MRPSVRNCNRYRHQIGSRDSKLRSTRLILLCHSWIAVNWNDVVKHKISVKFNALQLDKRLVSSDFMSIVPVPNGCAKGSLSSALNCMSSPILTNVATLVTRTNNYASSGKIDATSNMANDKVYIFHGTSDSVVSHSTPLLQFCVIIALESSRFVDYVFDESVFSLDINVCLRQLVMNFKITVLASIYRHYVISQNVIWIINYSLMNSQCR